MIKRYGSSGWRGDSHGHSLAARGIKLYASKTQLMDPVFLAKKSEQEVPSYRILEMVKEGQTFDQIKQSHPDAEPEVVRKKGIRAIDTCSGSNTMGSLDSNGIDMTVKIAKVNPTARQRAVAALNDHQKASFLPPVKVQLLKRRLGEIETR